MAFLTWAHLPESQSSTGLTVLRMVFLMVKMWFSGKGEKWLK